MCSTAFSALVPEKPGSAERREIEAGAIPPPRPRPACGTSQIPTEPLTRESFIDESNHPSTWHDEVYRPDSAEWPRLWSRLQLGQPLTGTVAWVPRPGAIGVGVDLGLPVGGFVDVLHLPLDRARWPAKGTTTDFTIWWMDERPQIRLMPADPRYRREDFDDWVRHQNTVAAKVFLTGGTGTPG
ncbi:hypothetical protein [Actinomadura coerulea]|uniref:hypothetical protein n=1 Tax=Actinomadura coerulea TaxID=46159 RepID=UPI0016109EA0|nr:hypothetical protein [Actinomadura coerulea]